MTCRRWLSSEKMHFREGGGQDRPDPPGAANGSGGEGQPHFQHHQFRNQHHQDQQYHHQDFNVYNRSFGSLTLQYLVYSTDYVYLVVIPLLFILILLRNTLQNLAFLLQITLNSPPKLKTIYNKA